MNKKYEQDEENMLDHHCQNISVVNTNWANEFSSVRLGRHVPKTWRRACMNKPNVRKSWPRLGIKHPFQCNLPRFSLRIPLHSLRPCSQLPRRVLQHIIAVHIGKLRLALVEGFLSWSRQVLSRGKTTAWHASSASRA